MERGPYVCPVPEFYCRLVAAQPPAQPPASRRRNYGPLWRIFQRNVCSIFYLLVVGSLFVCSFGLDYGDLVWWGAKLSNCWIFIAATNLSRLKKIVWKWIFYVQGVPFSRWFSYVSRKLLKTAQHGFRNSVLVFRETVECVNRMALFFSDLWGGGVIFELLL